LTNISLNAILDLGAAKPYKLTVGYNNDNPMAYTDFYAADSVLSGTDYDTVNGYLRVRAITPITGSVCGQNIEVLVFQAAAPNLEFGLATETFIMEGAVKEWVRDCDIEVIYQSGTIGAAGQSMTSLELVPSTGMYPIVENLMGEKIESYRALMQKPSILQSSVATITSNIENHNFGPHQIDFGPNASNWFSYFGTVFLGFAGSIREKWIIDTLSSGSVSLTKVPVIQNTWAASGTCPLGQVNPTVTPSSIAVETLVPYQNNELFIPAYTDGNMSITTVVQSTGTFNLIAARYYSGGPDMRLTMYRGPNLWRFATE